MARRLFAGASGYSFKEWCGPFYPEKFKPEAMLGWYSERLPAVEINNTFYRMPATTMLEHWVETTPTDFRFAIKASRRITHIARLKDTARDSVDYLYKQLVALDDKRGPVLFTTAAQPEEGSAAPARFPEDAARRSSCRFRIPQRHLVR